MTIRPQIRPTPSGSDEFPQETLLHVGEDHAWPLVVPMVDPVFVVPAPFAFGDDSAPNSLGVDEYEWNPMPMHVEVIVARNFATYDEFPHEAILHVSD
jgi:hypothetical protein